MYLYVQTSPVSGQIFLLLLLLATFSSFLFLWSETQTVININRLLPGKIFRKHGFHRPRSLCHSSLYPPPASAPPAPASSPHLPERAAKVKLSAEQTFNSFLSDGSKSSERSLKRARLSFLAASPVSVSLIQRLSSAPPSASPHRVSG